MQWNYNMCNYLESKEKYVGYTACPTHIVTKRKYNRSGC